MRLDQGHFSDSGIALPGSSSGGAEWADFNNDGFVDLLLFGSTETYNTTSTTILFYNLGGNNLTPIAHLEGVENGRAASADVNNDGLLDIAIASDTTDRILLYINADGNTFLPVTTFNSAWPDGSLELDWADVDRDGDYDLITTDRGSNANLIRNDTGKLLKGYEPLPAVRGSCRWIDADNDGWLDLLLTYLNTGALVILRNDLADQRGGGFFSETARFPLEATINNPIVGDFNNDGYSDFLLNEAGRRFQSFVNNGVGNWSRLTNVLPVSVDGSYSLADYDNDGTLDLVIQNIRAQGNSSFSYHTRLYRNTSTRTNHAPSAPLALSHQRQDGMVRLVWRFAHDQDQSNGLTYNVRIGSSPGAQDVVSPMSNSDGRRKIVRRGNAESRNFFLIKDFGSSGKRLGMERG